MSRANYPIYAEAVRAFLAHEQETFRKLRKDRTLSQIEKILLEARMLMREGNTPKALALLGKSSATEMFFCAERAFLSASCRFFMGDFEESAASNLAAYEGYRQIQDRRGCFLSSYNLSVDHSRLGLTKLADHYLRIAEKHCEEPSERNLLLRAHACDASQKGDYPLACAKIEQALLLENRLSFHDQIALLTVAVDIYFRAQKIQECRKTLERLSKIDTRHIEKPRVEFELRVLNCLERNESLPAPTSRIQASPEYSLKWRILRALQGGENELALRLWAELQEMSPQIFGSVFTCLTESEERSIFFSYLKTLRSAPSTPAADFPGLTGLSGKLEKLHQLLSEGRAPIRKEELIEKIWETPYDPNYDARFYKLVERLKKISPQPLLSVNRAYSYSRKPSQAAS